jgi:hypothetical protein
MSTQPSPPPPPSQQGYYGGGLPPVPVPNAELIVYVVALVVVGIIGLAAETVNAASWVEFALWTTAAYLVSRGLAKLRNVTER